METVSRQYEFARLNVTNTVMSKRKLKLLVDQGIVDGWDDPRMPTISGLRRKGYTPEAIRAFCQETGVAKNYGVVDERLLEHFVREDLKQKAPRTMAVLRPLKVTITNYPAGQLEWLDAENNAENPELGLRQIPFGRELYIEQDDFMDAPPPKYFRLFPGAEVRLKHAYFIRCQEVVRNASGEVIELLCTYDPETRSGSGFAGRKVKGTIHWVAASHAVQAEFRLFEPLVHSDAPVMDAEETAVAEEHGFLQQINPQSRTVVTGYVEAALADPESGAKFQFFRHGYFSVDPVDRAQGGPVFNRVVALKSSFEV